MTRSSISGAINTQYKHYIGPLCKNLSHLIFSVKVDKYTRECQDRRKKLVGFKSNITRLIQGLTFIGQLS